MKKGLKYRILLLVFSCMASWGYSQDIQWAQFYAVPLFQNPSFAGAEHCDHYNLQQRVQWPGLGANYTSTYLSYDRFFFEYRSGVGMYVTQDFQGISLDNSKNYPNADGLSDKSIDITTTKIAGQYSYELPIDKNHSIRAGLELGIANRILTNNFILPSEIDQDNNGQYYYNDGPDGLGTSRLYADVGTGMLYYSRHLYAGFSGFHLNKPNISFPTAAGIARLAQRGTFISGYKINFTKQGGMAYLNYKVNKSITPTFHYKFQEKTDQVDFGLYMHYDHLIAAVWYRGIPMKKYNNDNELHNNESAVIVLGWSFNGWKWSLSYDWVVSRLVAANPRGAYEFGMSYVPCRTEKKRKPMKRLPCPTPLI